MSSKKPDSDEEIEMDEEDFDDEVTPLDKFIEDGHGRATPNYGHHDDMDVFFEIQKNGFKPGM